MSWIMYQQIYLRSIWSYICDFEFWGYVYLQTFSTWPQTCIAHLLFWQLVVKDWRRPELWERQEFHQKTLCHHHPLRGESPCIAVFILCGSETSPHWSGLWRRSEPLRLKRPTQVSCWEKLLQRLANMAAEPLIKFRVLSKGSPRHQERDPGMLPDQRAPSSPGPQKQLRFSPSAPEEPPFYPDSMPTMSPLTLPRSWGIAFSFALRLAPFQYLEATEVWVNVCPSMPSLQLAWQHSPSSNKTERVMMPSFRTFRYLHHCHKICRPVGTPLGIRVFVCLCPLVNWRHHYFSDSS